MAFEQLNRIGISIISLFTLMAWIINPIQAAEEIRGNEIFTPPHSYRVYAAFTGIHHFRGTPLPSSPWQGPDGKQLPGTLKPKANASHNLPSSANIPHTPIVPPETPQSPSLSPNLLHSSTNSVTIPGSSLKGGTITIMCYHQFDAGNMYSVTREEFRRHLQYFKDNGFTVIPLSQALDYWAGKNVTLPEKALIITIDDGYRSVYEKAYPLLKEFNYPWVFYVYTDYVNSGGGSVTWEHLREMLANGMEIGCHSKSHSLMTKRGRKSDEEYAQWLVDETVVPKKIIEEKLGVPCRSFAYPYGGNNDQVRKAVEAAGFEGICNVLGADNYPGSHPSYLNRFVITRTYSLENAMASAGKRRSLGVTEITPLAGRFSDSRRPPITARIMDHEKIDPASVTLRLSGTGQIPAQFDPTTGTIQSQLTADLSIGSHTVTLQAREIGSNQTRQVQWTFQVPPPEMSGLPEDKLRKLMPARNESALLPGSPSHDTPPATAR